jgi:hypothetical protein
MRTKAFLCRLGLCAFVLLVPAAPWAGTALAGEAKPADAVRTVATVNGSLLVNGKPTFLTGIYGPLNDAAGVDWAVRELGVNVVIEAPVDQAEEQLAASGADRVWIMSRTRPQFERAVRHPNTIALSTLDEPETHGCRAGACRYPTLSGLPVFANYNGWISSKILWGLDATTVSTELTVTAADYRQYVRDQGPNAIVTQDDYFLSSGLFTPEEAISNSYNYMLAQALTVRAINPNAVNGMYVETWPTTSANGLAPNLQPLFTPSVVLAEAKAAIVGRARIVNWWAKPGLTRPDVAAAIKSFTAFVHRNADVFTAPPLDLVSYQGARVKRGGTTLVRDGKTVNTIMLMNVTDQPVRFTTRFPGLVDQQIVNLATGRSATARGGSVTVTIPPEDWWIGSFRA